MKILKNIFNKENKIEVKNYSMDSQYSNIDYYLRSSRSSIEKNYSSIAKYAYSSNPIIYRCIELITTNCASIDFKLYKDDLLLNKSKILSFLKNPCQTPDGQLFYQTIYSQILLSGNVYLKPVFVGEDIFEMHILRPDRVKIETNKYGELKGYTYNINSNEYYYPYTNDYKKDIIHIKTFNPLSDHYGISSIDAALKAIELHNAATRWNLSLLENAARPSGAIINKNTTHLTDQQFERLKNELMSRYQGSENAGRPLLLDGGLDWKSMSFSPSDMDFQNNKNVAAREMALCIGVPPMLLGIPGDNTYSNFKEANQAFWKQTIMPLIKKICASFNYLIKNIDPELEVRIDENMIEKMIKDNSQYKEFLLNSDFITNEEKRTLAGFNN